MNDIVVIGDINLDLILYGLQELMPLDREILATDLRLTLGGSSAILAHNLAALGTSTGFIGKLQDDELGRIALERLHQAGVDTSHAVHVNTSTPTGVTILLPHGKQRHILTYAGPTAELSVLELDAAYVSQATHCHISSFFLQKNLQAGLPEFCESLRARGTKVSLDTNDDPDGVWGEGFRAMLPVIDILLPNAEEAQRMAGRDSLDEAIDWLSRQVPIVAVKCGAQGAVVQRGKERWEIPAKLVTPVDTIGAGDSFNAGFLNQLLQGRSLFHCAEAGNAVAALSTKRPGGTEAFRDPWLRETLRTEPLFSV